MQRPHAFSAVKVGGERAYRRARRGETPELEPRAGHRLPGASCSRQTPERATFEIECSAGTYVRSLIADLEDAYCEELERTRIGPFRLEDADPERLVPLAEALGVPARARRSTSARPTPSRHGRRPACARRAERSRAPDPRRASSWRVAEPRDGELRPVVVFAPG